MASCYERNNKTSTDRKAIDVLKSQAAESRSSACAVTRGEVVLINLNVLLVEDNPDDERMTLRALQKAGVEHVTVARDGAEAISCLFENGDDALPHLVLLDLKLPKLNGLEVLERIRSDERTTSLPVVILTSSDDETDIATGYKLRANSYVQKPVDYSKFMDIIGALGTYWGSINVSPIRAGTEVFRCG
jgi:two-component system, response regulator